MPLTKKIEQPALLSRLGFVITFFLFVALAGTSTAVAQQDQTLDEQSSTANTEDVEYKDNLGRDTPRSSFIGFLKATEKFDYEGAVQFIDLRNLPHAVRQVDGEELARIAAQLMKVAEAENAS